MVTENSTHEDQAKCKLVPVPDEAEFSKTIAALPTACLAVIYFHAPWAEPCKSMSTILTALASTYPATEPPKTVFLSLDAEEIPDVSEQYNVTQVPLVVLQKDGKVLDSISGTDAGKVRDAVEKHAGDSNAASSGLAALPPVQKVTRSEEAMHGRPGSLDEPAQSQPASKETAQPQKAAATKEELDARLSELVKAAPVMLFMKGTPSAPQCGFSRQTVSILREKGVRYGFFNILADDEVRQGLKEFSDWPTFPQIYVGGELVGGLDILKEEFENDPDFLKDYSVHAEGQTQTT
ncbi:glutaredoxin [Piedraia hortae CBS 480.64]|uniref:Glutaredoxin n=1 Tax=Piedraia hortae CBS 480.64 TaxID=1314780 RepID=A0A6A7BWN9_9PEZI|nr:glutaredoxin [Piedraia hortae CBS 480.64]